MSAKFLGVDVGGTKVAVAELTAGRLGDAHVYRTVKRDAGALIDEIVRGIEDVGRSCAAVGIGIPSVVEFETGRARSSVNVPLADVPLRTVLGERLGLPVYVDNDATVAALAEAYDGEELVAHDLAMFTIGTGVGGGLVLGGRPYRGATGAAGELGHTLIGARLEAGAPDAGEFPQPGSLESLAAGSALDRLAREAVAEHAGGVLGELSAAGETVSGVDAVRAAKQGDEVSARLLRLVGQRLGIGIANAINTFDPEVVAVGGGVSAAGELLLEPAREVARRFVLPGVGERTEIRLARHGEQAGVLGAALLAKQELEAEEKEKS